jgi:uncharacterized protein YjbI with pentapeptide repeats
MFRTLGDAPLALGFMNWRFSPDEDALVLVLKGTYRLHPGARATPVDPLEVIGDVFVGDDTFTAGCRYPSDLVPHKPKADAVLVGKAYAPSGNPATECSVRFAVGQASLALRVTGDRYWLDPANGAVSAPKPFTEMELGYGRAFGGPGWAANPVGRGVHQEGAREAIERPLPNVEDPAALVRRVDDRPPPAGFGPLSPHWAHRMSKWPRIAAGWAAERWPWPPEALDYAYFNAAQPALQIDGYLRGDERIVCENLHPSERRFECELPRQRPRCFVVDEQAGNERFREMAMRLDSLWVDMEAETLALVWRGSLPVASESLAEVTYVYFATESLDDAKAAPEVYRRRLEVLRLEGERANAPVAAPANENDAPKPARAIVPPAPPPAPPPVFPPGMRAQFERAGVPKELLAAADRGDVDAVEAQARALIGGSEAEVEKVVERAREALREELRRAGHDPSVLDPPPPREPRAPKPSREPIPWSRERVASCLMAGIPIAGEDLSELDLSEVDFRGRDLRGCILKGAKLDGARFDEADLSGAVLASASAAKSSLRKTVLREADLTGAALPGADLVGANLERVLAEGANLTGAKLEGVAARRAFLRRADLSDADLGKANLVEARLDGARLGGASLRGADLTGASGEGMVAEGVDFTGATLVRFDASEGSRLARAKLAGCRASAANFMGADLTGADLARCDLVRADLSHANLTEARLSGANAAEADLTGAKLLAANLEGANLRAARLEGADLRRTNLKNASLYEAHLWKVQLQGAQLEGAFTAGTLFDSPVRGWAR